MKIIIGLGNPGEKYNSTRHNVGFEILDKLKEAWDFEDFKYQNNYDASISQGVYENKKIILAKPETFMNNSGEAVQKILSFYKLTPVDLIIIHDDLDIEIGKYKISTDSSAAGHNGIQDIFDKLGTQKIRRVRIGIEAAGGRINRQMQGEDYVLQNFTKEEMDKITNLTDKIIRNIL